MAIRKGFKFDRFREICDEIGDRHAELCKIIKDSDEATAAYAAEDDSAATLSNPNPRRVAQAPTERNRAARDDSDKSEPYARAQDSAAALYAAEPTVSMNQGIPGMTRSLDNFSRLPRR
jgi:hypothetical protein